MDVPGRSASREHPGPRVRVAGTTPEAGPMPIASQHARQASQRLGKRAACIQLTAESLLTFTRKAPIWLAAATSHRCNQQRPNGGT